MFLLGQRVGNYEIQRNLGKGTFGVVYLVRDVLLDLNRAIKVPHDQSAAGREALLRESRLLAALEHPNIVRLVACDEQRGTLFVVLEWVDGQPLSRLVDSGGPMAPPAAMRIARQVLAGLDHAHRRRLVHGDLSAENILVAGETAKITDFGIARAVQIREHDASVMGNPYYMAPEHFAGEVVFASDVYSAGVVLYEMLTGALPYRDPDPERQRRLVEDGGNASPRRRNPRVPSDLDEIVARALAVRVADRYPSAEALLSDLTEIASFGPGADELEAARARVRQGRPRRPAPCWNCRRPRHPDALVCAHCGAPRN